ncbi:hypothetical protein GCM10020295_06520 [Streptomyces cinereospinus]
MPELTRRGPLTTAAVGTACVVASARGGRRRPRLPAVPADAAGHVHGHPPAGRVTNPSGQHARRPGDRGAGAGAGHLRAPDGAPAVAGASTTSTSPARTYASRWPNWIS